MEVIGVKISKAKLNVALARKQWNQRDLRDNAVVSAQTILNLNKGKTVMPATVGKIAAALGVDVTEIIEDER
ncbi:MAG: XRE family transcriptional regulator [Faecalibacterium prausnitzii]|nr:XRE family transcriptional regulator [Faecalibacterium prausnitzii]